jgi:pimeloyl-ACP methyl ester carboxylesterase
MRFAYVDEGSGEPLVFVHGSLGSWSDFSGQVEFFRSSHRAVAYSRRFHPPNWCHDPGASYTLHDHAEDLARVISVLDLHQPAVISSSWGGYAALLCAIVHPGLIRALVLGEPPMLPLLRKSEQGRSWFEGFLATSLRPSREAFLRGDEIDGVRKFYDGIAGRTGAFDRLGEENRNRLLESRAELRLEFLTPFEQYMPEIPDQDLRSVDIPVLLLNGERSPRMFGIITDELERLLPNNRRRVVPLAGHSMNIGNPRFYNVAVQEFLAQT